MVVPKINSSHGSETRNIINAAIDSINVQGKTIQDLVAEGQLTPAQYATLLQTVNGLISKGEVAFEDIDINKGKLLPKHLSEEVLRMMTGDAPVNAVPADRSITRNKLAPNVVSPNETTFFKRTKNLFGGSYLHITVAGTLGDTATSSNNSRARAVYAEITEGRTYNVKIHDPLKANRFRAAVSTSFPEWVPGETISLDGEVLAFEDSTKEYTFTAPLTGYIFIQVSFDTLEEPRVQIEEGSEATEYVDGFEFSEEYLPEGPQKTADEAKSKAEEALEVAGNYQETTRNLFDGSYYPYLIAGSQSSALIYDTGANRRAGIIPIEQGKSYVVTVHEPEKSNVFRIATHTAMPVFNDVGVANLTTLQVYNDSLKQYTFTADVTGYAFIHVSNESLEPKMQVEEGSEATNYIPHKLLKRDLVEPLIEESSALTAATHSVNMLKEKAQGETLFPKVISSEMIPTDPGARFIEYFDGRMWGYTFGNGDISYSEDQGTTWIKHTNKTDAVSGAVHRLLPTDDGEVLAMTSSGLYKSTGWSSGEATWSGSKITKHSNATLFQFSFDGDGTKFIIAEYGASVSNWVDSRNVWISTDMGETFEVVWDSLEEHGEEINAVTHLHGVAYDRWDDRFYFSEGHGPEGGLRVSLDDGSTWSQPSGYRDGALRSGGIQGHQTDRDTNGPTVLVATPKGLVMGSDNANNGMFGLVKKRNIEDEVVTHTYNANHYKPRYLAMFAIRGTYDELSGSVYIAFRSEYNDVPPIILVGTPTSAALVYEYPNLPVVGAQDHFGAIARLDEDTLVTYAQFNGTPRTFRAQLGYAQSEIKALIRLELKELGLI